MKKRLDESALKRYNSLLAYTITDGRAPSTDSYYRSGKRVTLTEADIVADPETGYAKKGTPADAAPGTEPASEPLATPAPDPATTPGAPAPAPKAGGAEPTAADSMIPNMDTVEDPNAAPAGAAGGVDMDGDPAHNVSGNDMPAGEAGADPNASREDILSQLIKLHSDKLKDLEAFAQSMEARVGGVEQLAQAVPEMAAHVGQLEAQVEELTPPTPLEAMRDIPQMLGGETTEDWWNKYWNDKNQNKQLSSSPYYPQQKGDQPQGAPQKVEYVMKASELPDLTPDQAATSFGNKPTMNSY